MQTALGTSLLAIKGFAAIEVGEVYARAEQLCLITGNQSSLYDVLTGLWYHHVVRGEIQRAQELAARFFTIARKDDDPARLLTAHLALSGTTWAGDFGTGCEHIDKALSLESDMKEVLSLSVGADPKVFARAFGCHAYWHIGRFGRATELIDEGLARARTLKDPFTLAIALSYAAMLHQFDHNNLTAQKLTEEAIELCSEHQFAYYLAWARMIHGWTIVYTGDIQAGMSEMRKGLDEFRETDSALRLPYYLSLFAEVEGHAGQPEKALVTVEHALQKSNINGEKWHNADLYRLKAQLLLQIDPGKTDDVESVFQEALNIARDQGCKARELQIAVELGRFWNSLGKQREAGDLVADIYGHFPDSADNLWVDNAKALLAEIS